MATHRGCSVHFHSLIHTSARTLTSTNSFTHRSPPPRPQPRPDLFEERNEAPPDAPRRPEAVYLYGIDVMSTADVKAYFGDYGPRFVEWINDSSCGWHPGAVLLCGPVQQGPRVAAGWRQSWMAAPHLRTLLICV